MLEWSPCHRCPLTTASISCNDWLLWMARPGMDPSRRGSWRIPDFHSSNHRTPSTELVPHDRSVVPNSIFRRTERIGKLTVRWPCGVNLVLGNGQPPRSAPHARKRAGKGPDKLERDREESTVTSTIRYTARETEGGKVLVGDQGRFRDRMGVVLYRPHWLRGTR